jgi:uncharacterized protein
VTATDAPPAPERSRLAPLLEPLRGLPAARRQARTLEVLDHRPWARSRTPWIMGQTWEHVLFAHWPMRAGSLRRVVPDPLPIDEFDGTAWIGIVAFVVRALRPRGLPPLPAGSCFAELNVRTYVTVAGRPGVYFLSLDAASRLAVVGARLTYRLPYFHARMRVSRAARRIRYAS